MRYLILVLCWLTASVQAEQKWLGEEGFVRANAVAGFTAAAVDFDGTSDYLINTTTAIGGADAKTGLMSFWIRLDGGDGALQAIFTLRSDTASRIQVARLATNVFRFLGRNSSGTTILDKSTTATYTAGASWIHVLAAWDLATTTCQIYVNDSSDIAGGGTCTNDTIDYSPATTPGTRIGADAASSPGSLLNGCVAEFYWTNTYLDISNAANRAKFISGGKPVSLGSDGSTPTGTQPMIYLKSASPDFETNSGSGGSLTETGAINACSSSPSD